MQNKTIEINNRTIEYNLSGSGTPVIVLCNGHGMEMKSWERLYPEIETYGTVLNYNRTGLGQSSCAEVPQSAKEISDTLLTLLKTLDLPAPYILVGHSLGGLFVNYFARRYPQEAAGVVFVESGHPEEAGEQVKSKFATLIEKFLNLFGTPFKDRPNSEHRSIQESVRQINTAGDFPKIPIAVITGAKKLPFVPKEHFERHQKLQLELAKLSPKPTHIFASKSGHFPQITEPQVVLKAIKEISKDTV